jgi:hypothetical protein
MSTYNRINSTLPISAYFCSRRHHKIWSKRKSDQSLTKTSSPPALLYAGLKGNNLSAGLVYKSDDSGKTWLTLNNGEPTDPYVADIQSFVFQTRIVK